MISSSPLELNGHTNLASETGTPIPSSLTVGWGKKKVSNDIEDSGNKSQTLNKISFLNPYVLLGPPPGTDLQREFATSLQVLTHIEQPTLTAGFQALAGNAVSSGSGHTAAAPVSCTTNHGNTSRT